LVAIHPGLSQLCRVSKRTILLGNETRLHSSISLGNKVQCKRLMLTLAFSGMDSVIIIWILREKFSLKQI